MKFSSKLINLFRPFQLVFCVGALALSACTTLDRNGSQVLRKEITDVKQERKDDSSPRKRLVILPFLDTSENRPQSFRDHSRAAFITDLNRSGEIIAIDSGQLNVDVGRALERATNEYKWADLTKPAQALGVSALLEGKLMDIRIKRKADNVGLVRNLKSLFEVVVRVRIYNVRTNKEIFNTVKTVTLEQENVRVAERVETDKFIENNLEMLEVLVKDAFLDFSPQIIAALDRVSWEGRIAAINGDRIYINVGRVSGIQVGDLLKVTEDGDDVYDPESGSHLGRVPGRLKGTLEVISYFGNDGSIAIVHSGSGFKENDRVELY